MLGERHQLSTAWAAWVERMVPPGLDEEALLRARFLVAGWSASVAFCAATLVLYALAEIWSQVALTAMVAMTGVTVLWLHRRGVAFTPLAHASLAVALLGLGSSTLAQRPADYSSLALHFMVPLLATFLFGRRASVVWLLVTIGWAALGAYCADRGWLMDFVDPMPTVTHAVNFAVGLTITWLFARFFDDLRTQAIERPQAANRARSAFLANISHEIRTPMNGVLGMTEVLLLDELAADHREKLATIQRSGRTMVSLIDDLLDISKMEAGKLSLELADFNLRRVLTDVQGLLGATARARALSLVVEQREGVPDRVRGDGLRLTQVLTNLLSNAVKFTAQGEVRLDVTARREGHKVFCRFVVTDTGPGIAPEVIPRLFTAFQQGDSSTTRRYGGTGLGLALSQQLVTLMGGRIEVQSTLGRGSTFQLEIPFDEAEAHSQETPAPPSLSPHERWSVLVVDDNPVNLKVAMSLVEKAGFHAEGAVDGRAAVLAVQQRRFALVLMDCHMPEMDGFEATERIRAMTGAEAKTPIVALTASAMPDEVAACRRVGMNAVLTKPVSFAALCELLEEQLGRVSVESPSASRVA